MTMKNMVEEIMNKVNKVENKYYNAFSGNVFDIAMYLYMRYGEIPYEIDNENVEDNLDKLGDMLRRYDSLFNESLNDDFEELIEESSEE